MQQHFNGSPVFNRTWAQFKAGFGDASQDFWFGNDRLHELTKSGGYKMRFDLLSGYNMQWYWAEYAMFIVMNESMNYMLYVGGYSGNAGDAVGDVNHVYGNLDPAGSLNGSAFSTYDRDTTVSLTPMFEARCRTARAWCPP